MNMETFRPSAGLRIAALVSSLLFVLPAFSSGAETPQVPWECSNYEGSAQTRCMNTFIELQREKIQQLEGQLRAQQSTANQLKDQLDRQATTTADLQRQLSERFAPSVVPVPYPYTYAYPPNLGVGLYFGGSGVYVSPYYRPYFGPLWSPRYYGPWGHRW